MYWATQELFLHSYQCFVPSLLFKLSCAPVVPSLGGRKDKLCPLGCGQGQWDTASSTAKVFL